MRKLKVIILLSLMFMVFGCGDKKNKDTLKVGMECGYAPYNWSQNDASNGAVKKDADGYCNGYDVQMAKLIAKDLGRELEVVQTDWDALLGPALNSGKVDLVIAGMTPTKDRQEGMTFSDVYYKVSLVLVVKKEGKYASATSLKDFKEAKLTGQLNTLHYGMVDQIDGVKKEPAMENFPTMIVALNSGNIDGYVSEKSGALAAVKANPNLTFVEFADGKGFEYDASEVDIAIGMKKGNVKLQSEINNALKKIDDVKRDELMDAAIDAQTSSEKSFFKWVVFFITSYKSQFLKGTIVTLLIAIVGTIVGFILGLLVALVQKMKTDEMTSPISKGLTMIGKGIMEVYVTVFRGTPMIVQAMLIFYGLTEIMQNYYNIRLNLNPVLTAMFIVSINTGAYMAEIIRGGIESVDPGQVEGAQSIGMSHFQTMKHVIFPQAIRNSLPSMGNEFIINIKDTSVLSIVGVSELFRESRMIAGEYFKYYEVFIITSLIYLFLTIFFSKLFKILEKKLDGNKNFELTIEEK